MGMSKGGSLGFLFVPLFTVFLILGFSFIHYIYPTSNPYDVNVNESPIRAMPSTISEKWSRLVEWGKDNGIKVSTSIEIRYISDYIGVGAFATKPIKEKEVLVVSPLTAVWQTFHSKRNPRHNQVLQFIKKSGVDQSLFIASVALMLDRNDEKSFWKPYLDVLPFPDCPFYYTEDELAALQNPRIAERRDMYQVYYQSLYAYFRPQLEQEFPDVFNDPEELTEDDLMWALNTLLHRAFEIHKDAWYLIPLLDVFNHNVLYDTSSRSYQLVNEIDDRLGRIYITTTIPYQPGDEIFFSYSTDHTSVQFLLQYNFVMPDNLNDFVLLKVTVPNDDPHYTQKKRVIQSLGYEPLIEDLAETNPPLIVEFPVNVRKACVDAAFLDVVYTALLDNNYRPSQTNGITSERVEALKLIIRALARELDQMPTTLEQDEQYLRHYRSTLSTNMISAISFRIETKKVLKRILNSLQIRPQLCSTKTNEWEKEAQVWDVEITL